MSEILTLWSMRVGVQQIADLYGISYNKAYGRIQRELRQLERELYNESTL